MTSTKDLSAAAGAAPTALPARLPIWKLLAFTMAGFIAIMTETIPAGLLPQISLGLKVSEAFAGQLVTLYAFGSVVAAIPVVAMTRGWRRRRLFVLAIAGFFVFNTLTAVSSHYGFTLAARFVAGMAAGLTWGLLAGYARRMVPAHQQGRALAIVGVGQPIALALGVPLGTYLGGVVQWQGVFWIMSGLSLLLIVWILSSVPDYPGQAAHERLPISRIFRMAGIRPILFVIFVWILAHNVLYTFIAPFLGKAGMGERVDLVLLLFGVSAVVGIWFTGVLIDSWLRGMTLLSLAVFVVAAVVLGLAGESRLAIHAGIVLWGVAFGGAPVLLQTAIADAAGDGADVAQSMLVTVFNLAVAGGGLAGGLLLQRFGPEVFPWTLAILGVLALAVVCRASDSGFKPGHRVAAGQP